MDTAENKPIEEKPAPQRRIIKERDEVRDYIAELTESAVREIVIFAPQLDGYIFNTTRVSRALASFSARHRYNLVRIVVEDVEQMMRDNDRLVSLCRRLSDFIQIHKVGEEHSGIREMFMAVDHHSYLHQEDNAKPEHLAGRHDTRQTVMLVRRFREIWDRSEPISALRTAGL
ncbi:MAG: hypothetical protein HY081_10735 [Gammaproteobacteria bacterium]|nr:hypothetical protein [Gammaproteobacteria bacterium]